MGTCSWRYHHFSIPIPAVWSGLRKNHPEHTDQQLQIRGWGKEDEKKKSPVTELTSIYRDCSASFHWSHSSYRRGKGSRRRRKTSYTRKKGTAASKTGNTDYTTHLGNIHTETQLSQGSKHLRKNLIICPGCTSVNAHVKIILKRKRCPVNMVFYHKFKEHMRQSLSESCQNMIHHFVLKILEEISGTDFMISI